MFSPSSLCTCTCCNLCARLQSRSGCACAGPYGTTLVAPLVQRIVNQSPEEVVRALEIGAPTSPYEWLKPGWTRVYLSHLMTPTEVNYVIRSVLEVARDGWKLMPQYDYDRVTGAPHQTASCWLHSCVLTLPAHSWTVRGLERLLEGDTYNRTDVRNKLALP